MILDSSPQFLGLVNSNFLVQRGYDDGVWVFAQKIQTNINEGIWEIYDDNANSNGFNLVLPAQTIGEEFIKDKPINTDGEEIEREIPLRFKFESPAVLQISGDKLEKNMYLLPVI